jgi:hypothetical protein
LLDAALDAQIGSDPGEKQHDQPTADHDAEREEWHEYGRPILRRKIGQADFPRGEAHAGDKAAEDRDGYRVAIGFRMLIRNDEQHFVGGLLVAPPAFDRRKLGGLVIVDVVAVEMAEEALHWHEDRGEIEAHAQRDSSLGMEFALHQVLAATQKAPVRYEATSSSISKFESYHAA